jgi:hypothetical protein
VNRRSRVEGCDATFMNEEPKGNLQQAWNEPRHFCFWLTFLSVVAWAVLMGLNAADLLDFEPAPWLLNCLAAGFLALLLTTVGGLVGFFLAWIPPVHRLFAWLLQRRFLALTCLAALVALFYLEEDLRGRWAWERFKREWEAKGEKFELIRLAPTSVPDDQNFAMAPLVQTAYNSIVDRNGRKLPPLTNAVSCRIEMPIEVYVSGLEAPPLGNFQKGLKTDLAAWQGYYRQLFERTNLFPVPPQAQTPAADVLFALNQYSATLDELQEAGRRPLSRFPLEYDADDPAAVLLPHLARMKNCARVLQLRAVAELEAGQPAQALQDIELMLRLADAIRDEPILISHLVRIAIFNLALQPVWEGLTAHRWDEGQLTALEQDLGKADFLADYQAAMRGEQTFSAGVIDYVRRRRNFGPFDFPSHKLAPDILSRLIPSGWFYQNQVRCARLMVERYVPLADPEHRTISPAAAHRAEEAFKLETREVTPFNVLERMLIPALSKAVTKFAAAQVRTDQARLACALERYRLVHGEYPETLDVLAPQFIPQLPRDVINGQPLHYRRVDRERYILYSVGWNEADDSGQVVLKKNDGPIDMDQGDWVWRAQD